MIFKNREWHYAVLVTSKNPSPNEIDTSLNNYASFGWRLKCAIPNLDDESRLVLIFERE